MPRSTTPAEKGGPLVIALVVAIGAVLLITLVIVVVCITCKIRKYAVVPRPAFVSFVVLLAVVCQLQQLQTHIPYTTVLRPVAYKYSWWRGTVVERRSLAGELSLSCARPAADG